MDWLTPQLRKKVREVFEPRYKRKLTEAEVEEIADNLSEVVEVILNSNGGKNIAMTILEARKKLGEKADKYTDVQLQKIINMLTILCSKTIDLVIEKTEK